MLEENINNIYNNTVYINSIWLIIAGSLVFFMNAGFAMLETGLCRQNNAINILAKNLIVFCISAIGFWLFGFGLMFGDSPTNVCPAEANNVASFWGQQGFYFQIPFPTKDINSLAFPSGFTCLKEVWKDRIFTSSFFFQLTFAGTAATIVSGAVAERIKFYTFLWFSFFLVAFIYPLMGHFIWGHNGWIAYNFKFHDFAGSTVVHSVGGVAALVGAMLLKPRNGRFNYNAGTTKYNYKETKKKEYDREFQQYQQNVDIYKHSYQEYIKECKKYMEDIEQVENNTTVFEIPEKPKKPIEPKEPKEPDFKAHNLSLATLGCFILWLGWLGFNGGSTTNLTYVPHIITTTMIASATGGLSAIWFFYTIQVFLPETETETKSSKSQFNRRRKKQDFLTTIFDRISEIKTKPNLSTIINGILCGLVSVTASSAYVSMISAIIIGIGGGIVVLIGEKLLEKWLKIDDPVSAIPVHLGGGFWGTIAVGIFADPNSLVYTEADIHTNWVEAVIFQGLGWFIVCALTALLSWIAWIISSKLTGGMRVIIDEEKEGSDGVFER